MIHKSAKSLTAQRITRRVLTVQTDSTAQYLLGLSKMQEVANQISNSFQDKNKIAHFPKELQS